MIGEFQPVTRVTVDPNWWLNTTSGRVGTRPLNKLPIRWWQDKTNSQFAGEIEIPNLKTCIIDRSLTEQASTIQLIMYNNVTPPNGQAGDNPDAFGRPGYFSYARGVSLDAQRRWGQVSNGWKNLLRENALLRVYQGYGGQELSLGDAIAAGNVMLTGVFLVDNVAIESGGGGTGGGSGGLLTLNGRDMAKLLTDQYAWPPTIPQAFYTGAGIMYWHSTGGSVTAAVTAAQDQIFPQYCQFLDCSGSTDDAKISGHIPSSATDGKSGTYYLSEGKDAPQPADQDWPWIEFTVNCEMSALWLQSPTTFGIPGYSVLALVAVMQEGVWQPGEPVLLNGIPQINSLVVTSDGGWVNLGQTFQVEKIRLTFCNLAKTNHNPPYRAALSVVKTGLNGLAIIAPDPGIDVYAPRNDLLENYWDYAQIVSDFCMWAGFFLRSDVPLDGYAQNFGTVEYTGAYNTVGPIPASTWDKTQIIDCITTVAQIVGYIFRVGERGEIQFTTPNWWAPGNFDDSNTLTKVWPVLDESVNLTDYIQTTSDQGLVSEIIVAPEDPYLFGGTPNSATVTRFVPPNIASLHGINKPAMIGIPLDVPVSASDQAVMAELLAIQCYFTMRQGQATAKFDPAITPDTQIKIYDRVTGEANIHYVVGVHTEHDIDTGTHLSTYATYWLGDEDRWVINSTNDTFLDGSSLSNTTYNDDGVQVSKNVIRFLRKGGSKRSQQFVLAAPPDDDFAANTYTPVYEGLSDNILDAVTGESASGYDPDSDGTRTEDYSYGTTVNATLPS